jgi:hypothetical protein
MKAPNEIKRALEICAADSCRGCPYEADYDCYNKNKDTLAYIQQLEAAQPKWISVEDELPPVGKKVLACANNVRLIAFIDCEDVWHRDTITYRLPGEVTHWMPMPKALKEET